MTRCEQQDSLLQEQREKIRSLEADCDDVSPIGPNEVERLSAVNGCTWSLGGMETPGWLVVTRIPDVNVPVCVVKCMSGTSVLKCVPEGEYSVSEIACMSACMGMVHGPIQTGDMSSEPGGPHNVVWVTALAPPDAACEVRSVFCEWPKHAHLRDRKPAPEHLVHG